MSDTDDPGRIESSLVDLSDVDLEDLAIVDNPVLADSLRRIRDEIARPDDAVAGFQSSI